MKIVLLGTGGPRPDSRRNASTTLIRLGDENILFDAGRGVVNQLVRAGVALNAVNPVAVSGGTIACDGIDRIARGAHLLVHCCYMGSAEIDNDHFRRVMQYTLAGGDTVGKIAARAKARTLVLTHHRPRKDDRMLAKLV